VSVRSVRSVRDPDGLGRSWYTDLVALSVDQIEAALHRLWIGASGTSLRDEDRKKSRELVAFLRELAPPLARRPRVLVDAAAGKGYVGLLCAELLLPPGSRVVVLERNAARVESTRAALARAVLRDVVVEIRQVDVADHAAWPAAPDVVVALHACGPASDAVIDAAIAAASRLLYLVPCCTGRAVAAMPAATAQATRLGIPRHAAVRVGFTESVVAAERTLRLEAAGYETTVAPLVPPTVTPYHLIWRARRVLEPTRMARAAADHARLIA
jgi:hypothetical protein